MLAARTPRALRARSALAPLANAQRSLRSRTPSARCARERGWSSATPPRRRYRKKKSLFCEKICICKKKRLSLQPILQINLTNNLLISLYYG